MKRIITFLILSALYLGTAAGLASETLSPHVVTEKFWEAIQRNDLATAHQYIASDSLEKEDLTAPLLPIAQVELGKTIIDKEQAWVETTITVHREETVTIPIKTILIHENQQWKVRYQETVTLLTETSELARLLEQFGAMTEQFAQKFNQSLQELQRSLPEVERGLKDIESKLKAQIPEIQKRLEDLGEELEKLFKSAPPAPPSDKEKTI
jgi:hypothetical protein